MPGSHHPKLSTSAVATESGGDAKLCKNTDDADGFGWRNPGMGDPKVSVCLFILPSVSRFDKIYLTVIIWTAAVAMKYIMHSHARTNILK